MTLEDLRAELKVILELEEQPSVHWPTVKARCLSVIGRLNVDADAAYPHDLVYHFLDDPDIRQKDAGYGQRQRHNLTRWLSEAA